MARLSISLLGGFDILLDGQPVTAFGADKVRALLAYLAVEGGRPHRRAALAGLLWPELPEERAAHNFRQSLLRLRRALRDDDDRPRDSPRQPFLLVTSQDVQLNPLGNHRLDVADFVELLRAAREHRHANAENCGVCTGWLRQAADLYRGDLLAGFALRDSVPFEEWQLAQQEALHGQALEVLGRLADHHERRGEPAQVLEYARRLVALEPWQERAQAQVMAALAQSGQEAAALEQYATYSRMLSQEFGLLPSAEVTALYEQIRGRHLGARHSASGTSGDPGPANAATPAPGPWAAAVKVSPSDIPAPATNERRQVTALVCRRQWGSTSATLAGATGGFDPEELHEQMARCSEQCAPILERFGGLPQPRQGADCLTYFGYPVAQEDAARRAVSAGLAIIEAGRGPDPIRIGIHTGIMVSTERGIVGNAPDLARDAMHLADRGRVIITADTERLVSGWFECERAGGPGSVEHTLLYVVRGERVRQDGLEWLAAERTLTPLAGRKGELQQLVECLGAARLGHGRMIALSGDPGIGKSRLVWELKQRAAGQARWIESRCSPYFQNTSLHPIKSHLEQLLDFRPGDDAFAKRDKLTDTLTRSGLTHPASLWLMSLLLGLPTGVPAPQIITQEQRERIREIALALVERESAHQPIVLVIEDLHWADPTSLVWIGRSLDELLSLRCVVLLTWRSQFAPPWAPRRQTCSLELGPLSRTDSARMVADIARRGELSDEAGELIVRQTDGVPLYIEELTQSLLDPRMGGYYAGVSVEAPATPPAGASASLAGSRPPATLLDSLTAHLDRAGPAKETAQWAAVLGRGFSHELLAAVVPFDQPRLEADLAVLLESGLIIPQEVAARRGYAFKHALMQDAAYTMLLKRTRQAYHRRIAETIVSGFRRIWEDQPEVLAHHYSEAGLRAESADQWMRAGERAKAQGATLEARAFFDHALAEIEPEDSDRRWRALMGREEVLNLREERETQRADIEALLALAEACNDDRRRAQAFLREARYAGRLDDYQRHLNSSEAAAAAAVRLGDHALQLEALSRRMQGLVRLDRWDEARKVVDEMLARLPAVSDESVRSQAAAALAFYYGDLGDISRALVLSLQSAETDRRIGDRYHEARLKRNAGAHAAQLGLYAEARVLHEEALAAAEAIGDRNTQAMNRFDLSYVYWCTGDRERGRDIGERLSAELRAAGANPLGLANCLANLGLILEDAGELAAAASCFEESHALFASHSIEGSWIEVEAAEARAALALGRRGAAQRLALEVWGHLREHGAIRIDYPSRVYACIADVFAGVETPGVTEREPLEAGYRLLVQRSDVIENRDWRRSFLENEVTNRTLLARWRAYNGR